MASLKSMGSLDETPQQQAYPEYWEADVILRDGATAHLRPISPQDQELLQQMHSSQSQDSIYLRFFSYKPKLSQRELERFTTVDHRDRVCFVLILGDKLIGVGRYDRTSPRAAEVAFMISDHHQGRGIGSILLEHLAAAARENGINRFTAEVLPENRKMLHVFVEAGYDVSRQFEDGVVVVEFDIDPTEKSLAVMAAREHRAEARSVQDLLTPTTVAVIGASAHEEHAGHHAVESILAGGFTGTLYGVGHSPFEREGLTFVPALSEIPDPVDLAVIAVPRDAVEEAVTDCGRAGVRAVVVMTGGYAEDGVEGALAQRRLVRIARAAGMRVVGPASLGLMNTDPAVSLNASVLEQMPRRGGLGLFSQSGAVGTMLYGAALRHGVGLSSYLSAGNRADVSGNDLMQHWEDDPGTTVCGLYLQSVGNPRKFSRIARRLSLSKPVIVAKSEVTGLRLPPGHTGRVTQAPPGALDAMFRQAGSSGPPPRSSCWTSPRSRRASRCPDPAGSPWSPTPSRSPSSPRTRRCGWTSSRWWSTAPWTPPREGRPPTAPSSRPPASSWRPRTWTAWCSCSCPRRAWTGTNSPGTWRSRHAVRDAPRWPCSPASTARTASRHRCAPRTTPPCRASTRRAPRCTRSRR